jgi:hypothetical protein
MKKSQLGVRISSVQSRNMAGDLKMFPTKSKDIIVEAALMNLFFLPESARKRLYDRFPDKIFGRPIKAAAIALAIFLSSCHPVPAQVNPERLADAIRIEEGSNPSWLYGIHHHGSYPLKEPEARKRCLQTISHARKDWNGQGDFVVFLSRRYCPVNWKSWSTNVKRIYETNNIESQSRR